MTRYRRFKYARKKSIFDGKTPQQVFKQIYESNHWNGQESVSGTGSDPAQTQAVITTINSLIKELNIKSILDLPCGDFAWMQHVDLEQVNYIGGDIVEELVAQNQLQFGSKNVQFMHLNLISSLLPTCDLILTRDCLVHLSFQDIVSCIQNVKSSGCKYLLTTTFARRSLNYDIPTGEWRAINLLKPPFNFPAPLRIFNEGCHEDGGEYKDKSLGLWLVEDIPVPKVAI